jgi:hypothetical protein
LRSDLWKRVKETALSRRRVDVIGSSKLAPELALELAAMQGFADFPRVLEELAAPRKPSGEPLPKTLTYGPRS